MKNREKEREKEEKRGEEGERGRKGEMEGRDPERYTERYIGDRDTCREIEKMTSKITRSNTSTMLLLGKQNSMDSLGRSLWVWRTWADI